MKRLSLVVLVALVAAVLQAAPALAEDVTLSGVHICCGKCEKGIKDAVKDSGAEVNVDKGAGQVKLSGGEDALKKAIAGLEAAGYHGESSNKAIAMTDQAKALAGKTVKRLEVTGVHLCCGSCVKGVDKALKGVEGVKAHSAKNGAESFAIEGEFDAGAALTALNKAGYHAKPKN